MIVREMWRYVDRELKVTLHNATGVTVPFVALVIVYNVLLIYSKIAHITRVAICVGYMEMTL